MGEVLVIRLTRTSPTHHRFEYRRPDGAGEALDLETRAFLFHDLLRYAVECEAGLRGSFYGLLARVGGYGELTVAGGVALGGEVAITEVVVGALTGAFNTEELDPNAFTAGLAEYLGVREIKAPRWLTPAFLTAIRERMRRLQGEWRATPFGSTMELRFPLEHDGFRLNQPEP